MDEANSATSGQRPDCCPHLNADDPRCASRLCLSRLDQAFSVCLGAFHACPMFHRINDERAGGESQVSGQAHAIAISSPSRNARPLIGLTVHAPAIALRPTGT